MQQGLTAERLQGRFTITNKIRRAWSNSRQIAVSGCLIIIIAIHLIMSDLTLEQAINQTINQTIKQTIKQTINQPKDQKMEELSKENLMVITTTITSEIAKKRQNHLISEFSEYDLPVSFLHGLNSTKGKAFVTKQIQLRAMQEFERNGKDYGIIIQDDYGLIPNFFNELKQTVSLLPNNWRSLHLSPGFLGGRCLKNYAETSKIGLLNPEGDISHLVYHESGRFFNNVSAKVYYDLNCWSNVILVNKYKISDLIADYVYFMNKTRKCDDVVMVMALKENDYICRQPQLVYHWTSPVGGTTF